jgi:hypothetical protein
MIPVGKVVPFICLLSKYLKCHTSNARLCSLQKEVTWSYHFSRISFQTLGMQHVKKCFGSNTVNSILFTNYFFFPKCSLACKIMKNQFKFTLLLSFSKRNGIKFYMYCLQQQRSGYLRNETVVSVWFLQIKVTALQPQLAGWYSYSFHVHYI